MKKLLAILGLLFLTASVKAATPEEWNYIPMSSWTNVATGGPILFTSATIQFVGVTISSPSAPAGGKIIIYRSTSAAFTLDIATQTTISTEFNTFAAESNHFIPLFEMKNTSYTYLNKIGDAEVTYWIRCVGKSEIGVCPGLKGSGQR